MDFDETGATGVPAVTLPFTGVFCTISEQTCPKHVSLRACVQSPAEERIWIDVGAVPVTFGIGHDRD